MLNDILDYCEKGTFYVELLRILLEKIGILFTPTSGHAGINTYTVQKILLTALLYVFLVNVN